MCYVIVRPLSTVEYTSVASVFHSSGLTNLIHDRCSCTLFTLSSWAAPSVSGLFTLGWMCPLKREQARREQRV